MLRPTAVGAQHKLTAFSYYNYPRRRQSRGRDFYLRFSVCFLHDISKNDAARIIKLDMEMFHDEAWKPIYFEGQKVNDQSHDSRVGVRKTLPAWVFAL